MRTSSGFIMRRMRRGQSTIQIAVLFAVVAGALLAMAVYMRRAVSGKIRMTADAIGLQYAPGGTTSTFTTTAITDVVAASALGSIVGTVGGNPVTADVLATTTTMIQDTTTKTGTETVEPLTNDLWQ